MGIFYKKALFNQILPFSDAASHTRVMTHDQATASDATTRGRSDAQRQGLVEPTTRVLNHLIFDFKKHELLIHQPLGSRIKCHRPGGWSFSSQNL